MAALNPEEENYVRFTLLLTRVAPRAVRIYFDKLFSPTTLAATLQSQKLKLTDLKNKHRINSSQWNLLFPVNGQPDSKSFDVTLMVCLIRNLSSIPPPSYGYEVLPMASDILEAHDLARIKYYRNMLAHLGVSRIDSATFLSYWIEVTDAITRLSGSSLHQECLDLKTKTLDQSNQEFIVEIKHAKREMEDMKFLRTTMEKDLSKLQNETFLLKIKGLPSEILAMDEKSVKIYLNALESGKEMRRDIRIVVVGKKGSGKTSLVRRLFRESLDTVTSTNGIEIHRMKCNLQDLRWIKLKESDREMDRNTRLMKSVVKETDTQKQPSSSTTPDHNKFQGLDFNTEDNISDDSQPCSDIHSKDVEPSAEIIYKRTDKYNETSSTSALQELSKLVQSKIDIADREEYATISLWDFAGDRDFYDTHQCFLSPDALYLVVFKLDEKEEKGEHAAFKFWIESIHTYGTNKHGLSSEGSAKKLCPPVIAVGTHKDKVENDKTCQDQLEQRIDTLLTDARKHLRTTLILSNTDDGDDDFEKLKKIMLEEAEVCSNWNKEVPVKFIQLEMILQKEFDRGKRIISLEEIKHLALTISKPITDDDEINVFLKYQHAVGNLIFFEDLPDYIVLDPQWLSDVFKIIVTANKFKPELPSYVEWNALKQEGKLSGNLLDAIFKLQADDIKEHKKYIISLMEKFDLIVKPDIQSDHGIIKADHFYVPCLVQDKPNPGIDEQLNVPAEGKSICLCFKFNFLPVHLFNHLIVACCRKHAVTKLEDRIAIYRNTAVFDVTDNRCTKLMITRSEHLMQLQVWEFGKIKHKPDHEIYNFIKNEIERIVVTRYKMLNVRYDLKWKCSNTRYDKECGLQGFETIKDGEEYFCEEHNVKHNYEDDWSMSDSTENSKLGQDELNFVRMSKVVLDILCDVLYDCCKIKNPGSIKPRDQSDITYLYEEVYKQYKHQTPTKGKWGGQLCYYLPNHVNICDDIERIRLIRNEIQHSTSYSLDDTKYTHLFTTALEVVTRFDARNNPAGKSYVSRMREIKEMEYKMKDWDEIKKLLKSVSDAQHINVAEKIEIHYHIKL